jgi:hypothetical protein
VEHYGIGIHESWASNTIQSSTVLSIPLEGMDSTASHTESYIFSCVFLNCAVAGVARRRSWIARAKPFDCIVSKVPFLPGGSFYVRTCCLTYVRDSPSTSLFSYLLSTAIANLNSLFGLTNARLLPLGSASIFKPPEFSYFVRFFYRTFLTTSSAILSVRGRTPASLSSKALCRLFFLFYSSLIPPHRVITSPSIFSTGYWTDGLGDPGAHIRPICGCRRCTIFKWVCKL